MLSVVMLAFLVFWAFAPNVIMLSDITQSVILPRKEAPLGKFVVRIDMPGEHIFNLVHCIT